MNFSRVIRVISALTYVTCREISQSYLSGFNPGVPLCLPPQIPAIGRSKSGLTLREVWHVWNTKLRYLDLWHQRVVAQYEKMPIRRTYRTWAGNWFTKYRIYKEIGEEIDSSLAIDDGKTVDRVDEIIARLELFRQTIQLPSVQGLVDRLRADRGAIPFKTRVRVKSVASQSLYANNATPPSIILRVLDPWYQGLIADSEGKEDKANYQTLEGRWYLKFRYYNEIGEAIYIRLESGGGSAGEIIARLQIVRRTSHQQSIQGLIDGLRVARIS